MAVLRSIACIAVTISALAAAAVGARGRVYRNVVARFDGGGAPVVIGAHYDAFCVPRPLPGADDNASGAAGLLELARLLGRSVRGMIALEMIGCFTPRQPSPSRLLGMLYPTRGDFIAVSGRWRDVAWLREVKRGLAAALPAVAAVVPESSGIDASDHRSYWAAGIPAVLVTDTAYIRNPRYHTAADTAIDYARMARVVDGVANVVVRSRE